MIRSLENYPDGVGLNSANAVTWLHRDAHVSRFAPLGPPGILSDPVVRTLLAAVAHQGHSMVDDSLATFVIIDAAHVSLE